MRGRERIITLVINITTNSLYDESLDTRRPFLIWIKLLRVVIVELLAHIDQLLRH